jgi:predicted ribosome quality control (RQC) complex YloA/Tae2 family protein
VKDLIPQKNVSPEIRSNIAQLAIWTRKFSGPLHRAQNTSLQKITASEHGQLILSLYKPGDDRSTVLLSMKKGESGISTTHLKPLPLKQPNSIVQIARKYIHGRKIISSYAAMSPICIILEFGEPNKQLENYDEILEGPNVLILDLDSKPPRIILAKKYDKIPNRYVTDCGNHFSQGEPFFESWCEWSEDNTKTKKRACFLYPIISYCPMPQPEENIEKKIEEPSPTIKPNKNISTSSLTTLTSALEILPTHIRRSARTKLQFLARRITKQKIDLPDNNEISRLQKQSEGLKTNLYLWPAHSLIWYVPPQFIEEFGMPAFYSLKKHEKPGDILNKIHHEIDILKRRKQELTVRIAESIQAEYDFQKLISDSADELKFFIDKYTNENFHLQKDSSKFSKYVLDLILEKEELPSVSKLCRTLDISLTEGKQEKKIRDEKEGRLPFRVYFSSTGEFIRVSKSAEDGDKMIKMMPSNHTWLHVLTGEGSHVWLEKPKGGKKASQQAIREASILAVHHSKHSRAQSAEIQIATRGDIEKRKNLAPGKVLVRRCETMLIKYDNSELQKLTAGTQ